MRPGDLARGEGASADPFSLPQNRKVCMEKLCQRKPKQRKKVEGESAFINKAAAWQRCVCSTEQERRFRKQGSLGAHVGVDGELYDDADAPSGVQDPSRALACASGSGTSRTDADAVLRIRSAVGRAASAIATTRRAIP